MDFLYSRAPIFSATIVMPIQTILTDAQTPYRIR